MDGGEAAERTRQPEDLDRLFLELASAEDVDGVVDLYEPGAVPAFPPGRRSAGRQAIREVYVDLLASRPRLSGMIRPVSRSGDIAITSTVRAGNATVEVAGRHTEDQRARHAKG